jgi:hypothetical protein
MFGKLGLFFILCAICSTGCSVINPDEPQAAYIRVDSISVINTPATQGTINASISDAWIYIDDQLMGAFELPCNVPILEEGNHKISVGAGIKINGLSALRAPYPFYRFYTDSLNLEPGAVHEIEPKVSYFDSLAYAFMADFDDVSGNKLEASGASDTTVGITTASENVFEGNGSFSAQLLRDSGTVEFQMVEPVSLPKLGTLVYLELNYRTTHVLTLALRSNYAASAPQNTILISLYPTDEWKKVYVNLTRAVSEQISASDYQVFFFSFKNPGTEDLEILLDNMKIIY